MATPDELRTTITASRDELRQAIHAASARWNQPLPDDEWTPRQAAEHAIGSEVRFASEVCIACGYPGLDPWEANYVSANEALAGLEQAGAKADGRLKYVTDGDLLHVHEEWKASVADIMAYHARHLREHAEQLRRG